MTVRGGVLSSRIWSESASGMRRMKCVHRSRGHRVWVLVSADGIGGGSDVCEVLVLLLLRVWIYFYTVYILSTGCRRNTDSDQSRDSSSEASIRLAPRRPSA